MLFKKYGTYLYFVGRFMDLKSTIPAIAGNNGDISREDFNANIYICPKYNLMPVRCYHQGVTIQLNRPQTCIEK